MTDPEDKLNRFLRGNQYWHSDSSFKRISAKASLLAALEVPDEGGETEYADMRAAYDALDDATRQRIDGLVAVHSAIYSQRMSMGRDGTFKPGEEENLPPVRQPLVRLHEPTGRKSLFIGRHAQRIEQLDEAEGRALLDELLEGACQPPRVYRHRWSAGDLVLWDNRCMLHRGRPWDTTQRRIMRRTTVAGDPPPGESTNGRSDSPGSALGDQLSAESWKWTVTVSKPSEPSRLVSMLRVLSSARSRSSVPAAASCNCRSARSNSSWSSPGLDDSASPMRSTSPRWRSAT